ncbi:GNAT family N-acetyltransferase [Geodermatophilus sp. SYSU D00691]
MAGILFRRMTAEVERGRARRLLGSAGAPVPGHRATAWFGLWDLSAAEDADLLAVAACHPVRRGVVELDALVVAEAVRRRGHGHRLLHELVNRARADGAQRVVVRLPAGNDGRALLSSAGFVATGSAQQPAAPPARLELEL